MSRKLLDNDDLEKVVGGTFIPTFEDPTEYLDPVYYDYTPIIYTYYEPTYNIVYDNIDYEYLLPYDILNDYFY